MRGRTHTRMDAHTQVTPPKMQRKAFVIRTQLQEPLSHLSPPGLVSYAGVVKNGWNLLHTTSTHITTWIRSSIWAHTEMKSQFKMLVLFNNVNCRTKNEELDYINYGWCVWNKREIYVNSLSSGIFSNNSSQVTKVKKYVIFLCYVVLGFDTCFFCYLRALNSSSLCLLSQSFICTVTKQVVRLRVHWHWVSWGLNCCGAASGCIAEQVVPLCLSVFACVKLPPLPSSILSSSLQLCPSINPSTLSEPTPSSLLQ